MVRFVQEIIVELPPATVEKLKSELSALARLCRDNPDTDWRGFDGEAQPPRTPRWTPSKPAARPRNPKQSGAKPRFELAAARAVAEELVRMLAPHCVQIEIAGSIRRGKATVGDVELLFVSRDGAAECEINRLISAGILEIRGAFGEQNKFVRHIASGIPVDLFATTQERWANSFVCRTGPAESNIRIATAALRQGWRWNVYGDGFSRGGEVRTMRTEADVFAFVGLEYAEPDRRK